MTPVSKGLLLCAAHVALVASLGGKLLVDRATLPRVWAKTVPFDPDLPIRGRYVSLRVELARGFENAKHSSAALSVEDGMLVARPAENSDVHVSNNSLDEPVAFFIPEKAPDPSRRADGEELWVELTIPKRGPPRPIRLGGKKNGVLTPLGD